MGKSVFAYPSDRTAPTLSMTNTDAAYPAANGGDGDPAVPLKSSTTSSVITLTHSGSVTGAAFAIINHNLAGATVTLANTASYSQTITIPARTADGQCVNAWRDMRSDANLSATVWTLTITGAAAAIAIGEIVFLTSLRELNWIWGGSGPEYSSRWPKRILRTFYGSRLVYDSGVRMRTGSGIAKRETDRSILLALTQSSKGASTPFFFAPDIAVNDAWFAAIPDASALTWRRQHQTVSDTPIEIEEVSMGLPL